MSSEPAKNFSYTAYMHLGNYEKQRSRINNLSQTCDEKRDRVSENVKVKKRDAALVAAVVVFRLHVHYSVRLKSFSTPMKSTSCRVGLCNCPCHEADQNDSQTGGVSMYIV